MSTLCTYLIQWILLAFLPSVLQVALGPQYAKNSTTEIYPQTLSAFFFFNTVFLLIVWSFCTGILVVSVPLVLAPPTSTLYLRPPCNLHVFLFDIFFKAQFFPFYFETVWS